MSYRQIIPGEIPVPPRKGKGAGGLSYFSSGSVVDTGCEGSRPPEAAANPDSKSRQVKNHILDTIRAPRVEEGQPISESPRGVHAIRQSYRSTRLGFRSTSCRGRRLGGKQRKIDNIV